MIYDWFREVSRHLDVRTCREQLLPIWCCTHNRQRLPLSGTAARCGGVVHVASTHTFPFTLCPSPFATTSPTLLRTVAVRSVLPLLLLQPRPLPRLISTQILSSTSTFALCSFPCSSFH
jgi:hypothetical protein